MSFGFNPWQQQHWDARAAGNFIGGGAGSSLIVFAALTDGGMVAYLCGALLVALGLVSVLLEIGRPLRSANVVVNPRTSWMSREALVAPLVLASALAAAWGLAGASVVAALAGLTYLYCQARMLQACKGIPAWREPRLVPLMMATGLAEGGGAALLLAAATGRASLTLWALALFALLARLVLWQHWREAISSAIAPLAAKAIDDAGYRFKAASLLPFALALLAFGALPVGALGLVLQALAGALALAGGCWFKFTLITRGGFNQGFAIVRLPVRGVRRGH
jgi:phenylacetyl-CoA:acceptor oxidoreductase subunit 2